MEISDSPTLYKMPYEVLKSCCLMIALGCKYRSSSRKYQSDRRAVALITWTLSDDKESVLPALAPMPSLTSLLCLCRDQAISLQADIGLLATSVLLVSCKYPVTLSIGCA